MSWARHGQAIMTELVIAEGERQPTLRRMAEGMRCGGLEVEAIAAALAVVNDEWCLPPLAAGEIHAIAEATASAASDNGHGWATPEQLALL
jgi:hypothetical protein